MTYIHIHNLVVLLTILSSLSCPRLTVHKHLMISFIIFYFSIIVYMEPYVTFRSGQDYRQYVSTPLIQAYKSNIH